VLTITQSNAMLGAIYGRDVARNVSTNHLARIFFAPQELEDAREYSETLGYQTQRRESRSLSHSAGRGAGSSVSQSEEKRALMLPQELREMDAEAQIILLQGCKPILARKICYFCDPAFTARLLPPPEVPRIDRELFQACIEGRARQAGLEDSKGGVCQDPLTYRSGESTAPNDGASDDRIADQVDEFFDRLQLDKPVPPHRNGDESQDEGEDAGRSRIAGVDIRER
jgi:type IV secretion system protein VirD4